MITKMVDFKSEESVFLTFSAVGQEKNFMVKIFDIGRIFVKSGEREVIAQIGRVGMYVLTSYKNIK